MHPALQVVQLSPPECKLGYPLSQLERELDAETYQRLNLWMNGQTFSLCDGQAFNHDTREYMQTGCGPHGWAYYLSDVSRFFAGLPVID